MISLWDLKAYFSNVLWSSNASEILMFDEKNAVSTFVTNIFNAWQTHQCVQLNLLTWIFNCLECHSLGWKHLFNVAYYIINTWRKCIHIPYLFVTNSTLLHSQSKTIPLVIIYGQSSLHLVKPIPHALRYSAWKLLRITAFDSSMEGLSCNYLLNLEIVVWKYWRIPMQTPDFECPRWLILLMFDLLCFNGAPSLVLICISFYVVVILSLCPRSICTFFIYIGWHACEKLTVDWSFFLINLLWQWIMMKIIRLKHNWKNIKA